MNGAMDKIGWRTNWRIDKFHDPDNVVADMLQKGASIAQVMKQFPEAFIITEEWEKNVALNEGLQELIDIIIGAGAPTKWDNANAYIGVGDSNAATGPTQTALQAAANKLWNAMDATYPQRAAQVAEWRSTFASADANYAWEEYTVVNAADDAGKNLNRCIASKGTKVSGESWVLSVKITFS